MREVLELCRPVMDFFGIGIDNIERRALLEEWNKRRLRLYQVFLSCVPSRVFLFSLYKCMYGMCMYCLHMRMCIFRNACMSISVGSKQGIN